MQKTTGTLKEMKHDQKIICLWSCSCTGIDASSIIEEFMLDIMYEIPKDDNIGTVTITKAYIEGKGSPMITMRGTPAIPDSPLANN